MRCMVIVLMGVAGSGKSTVGRLLAKRLEWPFYEGDDFHPPANIAKMADGRPLTDADRAPWLAAISERIADHLYRGRPAIVTCSALKTIYRQMLKQKGNGLCFFYLKGDFDTIAGRLQQRQDHFMKLKMLRSQFEALEEPTSHEATAVAIESEPEKIVDAIQASL